MIDRLWRACKRTGHFRSDSDLEEELSVHFEMLAEDNAINTESRAEAQRRAHLRLGRTIAAIERIRDQEVITGFESCYCDFLYGVYSLRQGNSNLDLYQRMVDRIEQMPGVRSHLLYADDRVRINSTFSSD